MKESSLFENKGITSVKLYGLSFGVTIDAAEAVMTTRLTLGLIENIQANIRVNFI